MNKKAYTFTINRYASECIDRLCEQYDLCRSDVIGLAVVMLYDLNDWKDDDEIGLYKKTIAKIVERKFF